MKEKCHSHTNRDALGFCSGCGRYYCQECLIPGIDNYYCSDVQCQDIRLRELGRPAAGEAALPAVPRPSPVKLRKSEDIVMLGGDRWICVRSIDENNEPVFFCKTLTRKDLQIKRENPDMLNSPKKLYELFTDDLHLFRTDGNT